jgi:copG domain protein DNA-binding domain protein
MTQTVVTRFDVDTVNRLTNLAKLTGRTKSYYIKEAVKEKLDDMELVYLAQSRSEDVRAGRSSTISLDELQEKYEL